MTEKEVKKLLRKHHLKWKDFGKFMSGQTLGLNKDGSLDYYDCDVEHFIKHKGKYPHSEMWD